MKRFYAVILTLCAFGVQQFYAAGGQAVLIVNTQPNARQATSIDLFKAGFRKAGEEVLHAAKYIGAIGAAWSCGRQYQLVREYGVQALVSHPDSWPQWLWTNHRGLTAGVVTAGASYLGYKMYRYYQRQQAIAALNAAGVPPNPGMRDASTSSDDTMSTDSDYSTISLSSRFWDFLTK